MSDALQARWSNGIIPTLKRHCIRNMAAFIPRGGDYARLKSPVTLDFFSRCYGERAHIN